MRSLTDVKDAQDTASKSAASEIITPEIVRAWQEDGAVLIKNAFDPQEMAVVKGAFDYHFANLSKGAIDNSTDNAQFLIDLHNPGMWQTPPYQSLWNETKLLDLAQEMLPNPELWLWYEQIFFKKGSAGQTVRRTEWHQDLTLDPLEGDDLLRLWISLEPLDKGYALEFVRGSHRGPIYDPNVGAAVGKIGDDGKPMPVMPDIEADRSQWDIITWAVEPGDMLAFHPGVIHGGGATKPNGVRRTLTMVLLGRDARYVPKPPPPPEMLGDVEDGPYQQGLRLLEGLKPGDPMSKSKAPRLR